MTPDPIVTYVDRFDAARDAILRMEVPHENVHVKLELNEPVEIDVHGCKPDGLAWLAEQYPEHKLGLDDYGNARWLETTVAGAKVSYFL